MEGKEWFHNSQTHRVANPGSQRWNTRGLRGLMLNYVSEPNGTPVCCTFSYGCFNIGLQGSTSCNACNRHLKPYILLMHLLSLTSATGQGHLHWAWAAHAKALVYGNVYGPGEVKRLSFSYSIDINTHGSTAYNVLGYHHICSTIIHDP